MPRAIAPSRSRPIDRFDGEARHTALVDALCNQFVVHGDRELAVRLSQIIRLAEYPPGSQIIQQGAADRSIFFLLLGQVAVFVNGHELGRRHAGQHVGEIAMMDPAVTRTATILAIDTVVAARASSEDYIRLAEEYPSLWRRIAIELGARLQQRNRFVRQKNETPILFIGSSSESLPVVNEILAGLDTSDLILRPWTIGVFKASHYPLEDLTAQLQVVDFAALVLGPDDKVISRGKELDAARDNVLLELGLFVGALGRERTFFIVPHDVEVKIPSDLVGLAPMIFGKNGQMSRIHAELSAAIRNQGPR